MKRRSCSGNTTQDASKPKEYAVPPIISPDRCTGCGTCADICNSDIFVFDRSVDARPRVMFPDECWHCDSCVIDCPQHAVTLRIPLAFMFLHVDADTLNPGEGAR